jgi:ABC-type sugar transport system ATPase subunit
MSLLRGAIANGRFTSGELEAPIDAPDGPAVLGVRPEDVRVVSSGGARAIVRAVEPVGESGYLHLEVRGLECETEGSGETRKAPLLVASIAGRDAFSMKEGREVAVSLVAERCHAFDPESGKRVSPARSAVGGAERA